MWFVFSKTSLAQVTDILHVLLQFTNISTNVYRSMLVFMVALWNRAYHYIFALWFLLSFFFFFPRLLDVCHTSTHGVALVRISDAGLKRAARGSLFICFLLWNELLQFWQRFQRRTFADNHSRYVNMSHAVPNDQTAVIVLREVSYH